MYPDHDKFKIIIRKTVGKQILGCFYFEFMDENPSEVTFFFYTKRWILNNIPYLIIEYFFLLF